MRNSPLVPFQKRSHMAALLSEAHHRGAFTMRR